MTKYPHYFMYKYLRALKASISLSNTGVTLLERNCVEEAETVLKDALHLIRAAFPENKASNQEKFISSCLQRASEHLCRTTCATAREPKRSELSIVSDEDNLLEVLEVVSDQEKICAIRMDETRNYENVHSIDVEASIILFNYGSACRCLHALQLQGKPSLTADAFNFIQMSYGVVSRRATSQNEDFSRQLLVSVLAAQSLVLLSVELKMLKQSLCYRYELDYLRNVVDRLSRLTNYSLSHFAPAA